MNHGKTLEKVGFVIIALMLGVGLLIALAMAIWTAWQASWIAGAITAFALLGIALFTAGMLLNEENR